MKTETKGLTVTVKMDKKDMDEIVARARRAAMAVGDADVKRELELLDEYRYAWETALRWIRCGVSEEDDGTWTDINSLSPYEAMRRGMRRCLSFMEMLDRKHIKGNGNDDKGELE